jgi:hypothetical protein
MGAYAAHPVRASAIQFGRAVSSIWRGAPSGPGEHGPPRPVAAMLPRSRGRRGSVPQTRPGRCAARTRASAGQDHEDHLQHGTGWLPGALGGSTGARARSGPRWWPFARERNTKELMARIDRASPRAAPIYHHATRERYHAIASYVDSIVAAGEPAPRAPVVGPDGSVRGAPAGLTSDCAPLPAPTRP